MRRGACRVCSPAGSQSDQAPVSTSDCVAWGDVGRKRMAWEGRREEKREKRIGTEKAGGRKYGNKKRGL